MVRPLNDSPYLYGFHDPGAERLMNEYGTPGWIVFTEAIGSDPDDQGSCDYSEWANQGFGIIVRLLNGYHGEGSISFSARYPEFAQRCANFVRNSQGCHIWIIGNEPNHPEERPGGVEIVLPGMYAHCYRRTRLAIKALPGHGADQVILAPISPWNNKTVYPGNANGDWIKYFSDILMILGPTDCDGLALHTYTQGPNPHLVGSDIFMDSPFSNRQASFRAYQDFMRAVPLNMRGLPVYITQANQTEEWRNENSGWIQRAYAEIARWNGQAGNQKIRALVLFRWQKGIDIWGIQGKAGVIEDFRQALASEYSWPSSETETRRCVFLSHSVPLDMVAGSTREVLLEFRNDGDAAWIPDGPSAVRVGYRWLDAAGKLLRLPEEFDSFTDLPGMVGPDHEVRVRAHVTAPSIPGAYIVRWDLHGNDTGWFNDGGSVPLEVKLTVQSAMRSPTAPISFPETGYTAHGPFAAFYRHYSAEVAGFPISDQYVPESTGLPTQEWQRVVMEEYPEGQIRLRATGEELQQLRRTLAAMQEQIDVRLPGSRRVLRLPTPAITDAAASLPAAQGSRLARPLSAIRHLVVYHTGVEPSVPLSRIAEVHREMFGALLYHFVVGANGAILQTYPLGEAPASEHNWAANGVHIALAGEFEGGALPDPQFEATAQLAAWLTQELRLPFDAVKGASDFLDTPSPGDWEGEGGGKQRLLARMGELVEEKPGGGDAATLNAQIAQLQSALQRSEADLQRLQDELDAVRAQAAGLSQQLADSERERERLVARASELEVQIEALKREKQPEATPKRVAAPEIRDIAATLPRHELLRWNLRTLSSITQVAIHHSAVPANVPAEEVARYYVSRNTPGITYHYYIVPDGTIFQTNRLEAVCTHLHTGNESAVGVCIAGNFDDVSPTPRQVGAAASLVAWLCQKLNIPVERVLGHVDFSGATGTCPGRQWASGQQWQQAFKTRLQQALALDGPPEKSIGHYLLFWQRSDRWAREDWLGAMNYISRFRPTAGFSLDDALHSEYVTIVGGLDGVSWECEQLLLSAGCKVERIAGPDAAATQQILDQMAQDGKRFRDFGRW